MVTMVCYTTMHARKTGFTLTKHGLDNVSRDAGRRLTAERYDVRGPFRDQIAR